MTTWAGRTAAEISAAVREKRVTPREVVAEHLARIERLDGRVGAFRSVRAEAALTEADEVAARGDFDRLPLAGVPVAVKDNLAVRGESTRVGSAATPDTPAAQDHVTVARLRAAGAVVVGLTNVPELCVFGTTDGVLGTARNPWDPTRSAGGSSGGSAAAVAAGMVPIALGNDGMGSLRIPAANCGLVTIKPGHGVVPAGDGDGGWFGLSENGPLATTVEDARLMLSVLADDEPALRAEPGPLRVAVSLRSPVAGVTISRPYAAAAREAAGVLMKAGHLVRRADPPYPMSLATTSLAHWTAGTAADAQHLEPASADPAHPDPRETRPALHGQRALRGGPGATAPANGAVLHRVRRAAHARARPPLPQGRALARAGLAEQRPGQHELLAVDAPVEPHRLARHVGPLRNPPLRRPVCRAVGGTPRHGVPTPGSGPAVAGA
ncbi:Glutamyl-tRNA(Gln) amidotransferase subunit A, chloroplastic/mitochondrial [Streptomyces violarus]